MIDRIEDEPVRFFLRHRAQIAAWAALESETRQVAHRAMTTVGDRLAEDPPADAEIMVGDDGGYDARLLYRPGWRGGDGRPMAAVGIGWHPVRVDFGPGWCWIGVWCGQRDDTDALADVIRSSLAETAAVLELTNKGWRQWPLFKYGPGPTGEFWDDLRPWLEELEESVRTAWARIADGLERVLQTRSTMSSQ